MKIIIQNIQSPVAYNIPEFKAKRKIIHEIANNQNFQKFSLACASAGIAGLALSKKLEEQEQNVKIPNAEILSDEAFEQKKETIKKKIENLPLGVKHQFNYLNKKNIFLYEKVIQNDFIYNNESVQEELFYIMKNCDFEIEDITAKIHYLDLVLNNDKLKENEHIQEYLGNILYDAHSENILFIEKLLSEPILYENRGISSTIRYIIDSCTDKQEETNKLSVVNKYLGDPNLYTDENIQNIIGETLKDVDKDSQKDFVNYVFSKPELYKNPLLMNSKNFINLINSVTTSSQEGIAHYILSKEEILTNKIIMNSLAAFIKHLGKNNFNLEEANMFFDYAKNIDFDKIKEIAPQIESYSSSDIESFLLTHFCLNTTGFSKENLALDKKIADVISEKYIEFPLLYNILRALPLTDRTFGHLPSNWIDPNDKNADEIEAKVRDAIKKFKEFSNSKFSFKMPEEEYNFEENLKSILNKNVKVSKIGNGVFSVGYKIAVEGANPVVLKIYFRGEPQNPKHGEWAETPKAWFLNRFKENFAHCYFGKIPFPTEDGNDGFIVTEYLCDDGNLYDTVSSFEDDEYIIKCNDVSNYHNVLQGKIFDHGDVDIIKKDKPRKRTSTSQLIESLRNN